MPFSPTILDSRVLNFFASPDGPLLLIMGINTRPLLLWVWIPGYPHRLVGPLVTPGSPALPLKGAPGTPGCLPNTEAPTQHLHPHHHGVVILWEGRLRIQQGLATFDRGYQSGSSDFLV